MSICVRLSDLSLELRQKMVDDLTINSKPDFMGYAKETTIYPYAVEGDFGYFPFYYGTQTLKKFPNDSIKFTKREMEFTGVLRDYQTEVVQEAVKGLNRIRASFLSMATGKGKTLTSIYLSSRLKVKTCVLLFRVNLFEQWIESIQKVIPNAKIQTLTSTNAVDPDCDFYLINPISVMKRSREDFKDIGFLVADEAHALCSEKFSKAFLYFTPKWCLGLSATPERTDDLDKVITLHFGQTQISVPLHVEHDYYRFSTKLVPETRKNMRGHIDWNSVLEFQAEHPQRNMWITRVCLFFKERNILILCKRKSQALTLFESLKKEGESVDYTTGTKKKFDKDARILATTFSKSGVGFDHPKLDMLIVASDVEEMFAQYFGRCVRREDVKPIVVDFVDTLKNLERHYKTRKTYSQSVGGRVQDFHLSFPEFNNTEIVFE